MVNWLLLQCIVILFIPLVVDMVLRTGVGFAIYGNIVGVGIITVVRISSSYVIGHQCTVVWVCYGGWYQAGCCNTLSCCCAATGFCMGRCSVSNPGPFPRIGISTGR